MKMLLTAFRGMRERRTQTDGAILAKMTMRMRSYRLWKMDWGVGAAT
jgi:hypothetical protein